MAVGMMQTDGETLIVSLFRPDNRNCMCCIVGFTFVGVKLSDLEMNFYCSCVCVLLNFPFLDNVL